MNPLVYAAGPVALATVQLGGTSSTSSRSVNGPQEKVRTDAFNDRRCLTRVITHLRNIRQARGLTLREVSRRARVGEEVIDLAENGKLLPGSRVFRSWCSALNLSWDQVWSECLGR